LTDAALDASDRNAGLVKTPTGIEGLDEVTGGGLPRGRPTLVCGGAGCGKTMLAMQFLVRGALDHGEPGVFMSFEETAEDLADNVASLGVDLPALQEQGRLAVDVVRVRREEIEETGSYDLEGLFVRLGWAVDRLGAKRVVLDTIEALFAGLSNQGVLRSELRRLFDWLKERGLTAIVTAERGDGALTRHGLEEYVSDCVLLLDHRIHDQVSTRRLRVVKYRGSAHGTNEYPFPIDEAGFCVMPVTSLGLNHPASDERVSSGIPALDVMLGGGVFRGSSVLVTGTAGTGKTSLGATLADAGCRRGERCLIFSFEESPQQLLRNMRSIGLDLGRWVEAGLLEIDSARPTTFGIETHLSRMLRTVGRFAPRLVMVDPISAVSSATRAHDVSRALLRLIDGLKGQGITGVYQALVHGEPLEDRTELEVSSLMDTWMVLSSGEDRAAPGRSLAVAKSRGTAHARQARGFSITDRGIEIAGPPVDPAEEGADV
jgi:circadian clock protein KaiC